MAKDFLYCESTDTKIYANDVVMISTYPDVKWIAKNGWYKFGTAQKRGWYFISIIDKTILPIDQVDLESVSKDIEQGTSELRPTLKDIDATPAEVNYIVIPGTNIRLYDSDIVEISNKPNVKWILHNGWFIYDEVQNYGWYFVSIISGEILPATAIDLTLCTLVTVKTQGSERFDGKTVKYTRPFTEYDAETLSRTFITVSTIEQRDNLDPNKLIDGRIVRVNDVGGAPAFYIWNAEEQTWDIVDWGGGITKVEGTEDMPIILSQLEQDLYRVTGYYKVTPDEDVVHTNIEHVAFVSGIDLINIKVVTESSIVDYVVTDGELTLYTEYATKYYVDGEITRIEQQISEIISEIPDVVAALIEELVVPIDEDYIRSLFD